MSRSAWARVYLLVAFLAVSCRSPDGHAPGGPFYFATWTGYSIPMQPADPISEWEAKERGTYYVAYFDQDGRLEKFVKVSGGETKWTEEYAYCEGSIERTTTRASGEIEKSVIDR